MWVCIWWRYVKVTGPGYSTSSCLYLYLGWSLAFLLLFLKWILYLVGLFNFFLFVQNFINQTIPMHQESRHKDTELALASRYLCKVVWATWTIPALSIDICWKWRALRAYHRVKAIIGALDSALLSSWCKMEHQSQSLISWTESFARNFSIPAPFHTSLAIPQSLESWNANSTSAPHFSHLWSERTFCDNPAS
jgi:hypothetical protein